MIAHFVVVSPPDRCASYAVKLPILIGRSREAKFRIQQDRVSRRHCAFEVEEGVVRIRDLGSRNGTFLAGTQLPPETAVDVPPGSLVRVGSIEFRVEYDAVGDMPTVDFPAPRIADGLGPGAGRAEPDVEIRVEEGTDERAGAAGHGETHGESGPRRGGDLREFLDGLS